MRKPKAPRLVSMAVTTTITIIFWVFFTLYRILTAEPIPSVDPKLLEPIDATLDTNTLDGFKSRVFIESGTFTPISEPSFGSGGLEPELTPTPSPRVTPFEETAEDESELQSDASI